MVDEIHTIGLQGRGAVLEAVITRMKMLNYLQNNA